MIAVTIYSKPGCHLCDDMKAVVSRVAKRAGDRIAIEEIDITTDPDLEARYGLEIPVLLIDGEKVAKYRISDEEFRRAIDARARPTEEAG